MTIIQYPGKKNYIARWIVNNFPNNYKSMTYFEPFFGSGSVFFQKQRSSIETINDINSEITNLFLQIRDRPEELMMMLINTPWSRDEYDLAFEETDKPMEKARRCIVRYWFTVGANVRNKNGMRFEIKKNTGGLNYFHLKLPQVIKLASYRFKHNYKSLVQIENRNVFELLPKYNRENVLMYLDPPYLLETRNNKKLYNFEFTDDEHEELLRFIVNSRAKIIISGYESDLYKRYLSNWRIKKMSTKDQAGNQKLECIWMNYPETQNNLFDTESI